MSNTILAARSASTPTMVDFGGSSVISDCRFSGIAKYKGMNVHVSRFLYRIDVTKVSRQFLSLMQEIKHLNHPNINRFIGICNQAEEHGGECRLILHVYWRRGGLNKLLKSAFLDADLKFSLAKELAEAISAVRRSSLRFHGNITFKKCLVDEYFGLKLTDIITGKLCILNEINTSKGVSTEFAHDSCTPTEVLRGESAGIASDIFAFGVIAGQLLDLSNDTSPAVGEQEQAKYLFRKEWEGLLNLCVREDPAERPLIKTLIQAFERHAKTDGRTGSLFDVIMGRLQVYSTKLENLVEERTQDLIIERGRCDEILREILPREVVRTLRQGELVQPEIFEKVSLMFSAVANFTSFVSRVLPFKIVHFLHELYSAFDVIVVQFKVYKVETIGDQYMVVSGLPESLGEEHANEICRLALQLQRTYVSIPTDESSLSVQMGIHSGSIAAGVVGFRQPRYCLFGDAVNTASRMLSTGEPTKIQLSFSTAPLLSDKEFRLEERGAIAIKGKGMVMTYWLLSNQN